MGEVAGKPFVQKQEIINHLAELEVRNALTLAQLFLISEQFEISPNSSTAELFSDKMIKFCNGDRLKLLTCWIDVRQVLPEFACIACLDELAKKATLEELFFLYHASFQSYYPPEAWVIIVREMVVQARVSSSSKQAQFECLIRADEYFRSPKSSLEGDMEKASTQGNDNLPLQEGSRIFMRQEIQKAISDLFSK